MHDLQPVEMVPSGGLLAPVMGAFLAVASGDVRHVLVYRTVQMMGGAIFQAGAPGAAAPRPVAPPEGQAAMARTMGDMASLLTYHAYSAANWLAMHARRHMHLYGTTKEQLGWLAINSRANAALNERARIPRPDHDGRLPQRPAGVRSVRAARLRRADRRLDRRRGVARRLRGRCSESSGARAVDGWRAGNGRLGPARRLPEDGVDRRRRRAVEQDRPEAE